MGTFTAAATRSYGARLSPSNMSGVVAYMYASASPPAHFRVAIGSPFRVVRSPATPTQRSFNTGWSRTPRTGTPSRSNAASVPHSGLPVMKDLVPSMGSNTHVHSLSPPAPSSMPCSSPKMACEGQRARTIARIADSASRSAIVTGLASFLSSIASDVRK